MPDLHTHAIIDIILFETHFLLDDKILSEIDQEEGNPKKQLILKMNVLRKVLAISNVTDMTNLIYKIYKDMRGDRIIEEDFNQKPESVMSQGDGSNAQKNSNNFEEELEDLQEDELETVIMMYD